MPLFLHRMIDMTLFLHDKSRVLTDIIVFSRRLATREVVVVAVTSTIPKYVGPHTGYESRPRATADKLEDTDAILTGNSIWGAKLAVLLAT